jgi:hypothetical protein
MTVRASSVAGVSLSDPPNAPIAVRAPLIITALDMSFSLHFVHQSAGWRGAALVCGGSHQCRPDYFTVTLTSSKA